MIETTFLAPISIGKPEWAKGGYPGVIKEIPVLLEQPFIEAELIKKETKPFKASYNSKFLEAAKLALKAPGSSYTRILDAAAEITKILDGANSELLLSVILPEGEESVELIEALIEAQAEMTKMSTKAQALATLRRSAPTFSEATISDVSKLHPELQVQLAIFAQTEQYARTTEYISDNSFFWTSKENTAEKTVSEEVYAEAAKK